MAKSRTDTESVLKLVIDGKQAKTSVNELRDTYHKLNTEVNNLKKTDDPKLYAEKKEAVQKIKEAWDEARKEIRGATKDTASFKDQLVDLAKNAAGGLSLAGGVYAVVNGVKTMIQKNAELSDSMAGVMKTTGLSEEAVDRLNEKFKKMDTRTANTQLLELAQVAGKLGYSAEHDVMAFVSAADKIGVALGEDLGGVEESVNSLGKLVNIFKINDSFGLEESLLKVGSAINTLGASGTANEKNLIDFSQRLAGVAPAANISLPQVLALGAVMDELGQSMESSSTAIGQFIVSMGADVPKYAKIAGMSVKDFSKLLRDDANEALLRVVDGSKTANGGIQALARNMGILEVSGARGIAAIGALADNVDLARERLQTANEAFDEGTSVLDEFNTVNTNLAANLEKIWNKVGYLWENSGFRKWMTDITAAMIDNRSEFERLYNEWEAGTSKLNKLESSLQKPIDRYDELTKKTKLNGEEQAELQGLIKQLSKEWPIAVTEVDAYGNALGINTGILKENIKAQREYLQSINKTAIAEGEAQKANQQRYAEKIKQEIKNKKITVSAGAYGAGSFERDMSNEELQAKIEHLAEVEKGIRNINTSLNLMGKDTSPVQFDTKAMYEHSNAVMNDAQAVEKRIKEINTEIKTGKLSAQEYKERTDAVKILTDRLRALNNTSTPDDSVNVGGGKGKGKSKVDKAKEEKERIEADNKKHLERMLKDEELFSANQLINKKAAHEREVAQLSQTYQKEIDKWEEYSSRLHLSEEQKTKAKEKHDALVTERDNAVKDLRLKQEKEYLDGVAKLRDELGNKQETELEKERNRINAHYDKLKADFAGNGAMLKKIEEDRLNDLNEANQRAEDGLLKQRDKVLADWKAKETNEHARKLAEIKARYDKEIDLLKERNTKEIQETEAFKEVLNAYETNRDKEIAEAKIEFEREKQQQLKDLAIGAAQNIADSVFSIVSQNIQAESSARISGLEAQRDKELSNKNLTEKQKAKIQEKYDKQIAAEKLRAWKAQKKADILSATINTALAVTKALPNWILAAAAGIAGAAQIAVIAAQKPPQFARGGFIPRGSNHAQGGINLIDTRSNQVLGNIEGGEPILSQNTYANNREIVDALLYTSQRQNGARIRMHPNAISAEQWSRNGGSAVSAPAPIVNVSAPGSDNAELIGLMQQMVDKLDKPKKVVLSKRLLEDDAEEQVQLDSRVNG